MTVPRGYVRGLKAAAEYCGISDRDTFRSWCLEAGIQPRIIRGQAYFRLSVLDQFMSPERNAPGALETFWNGALSASGQ